MAIICCSKNALLKEKCVTLYGQSDVVALPDTSMLKEDQLHARDVVIVDLQYCALQEGEKISFSALVLAGVPTFKEAVALLQCGVRGYGNRLMRIENLEQAVKSVREGQIWLPPDIVTQLIGAVGTSSSSVTNDSLLSTLSSREQEVARYVADGMSNKEMADKMYISLRTVKAHLSSIYEKTGLRNRLELGLALKK